MTTPAPGQDDAGLICGYLFDRLEAGAARPIDLDASARWLADTGAAARLVPQ